MHQLKNLIRLLSLGQSQRSVSRQTGISRTTITKYIERIRSSGRDVIACLDMDVEELEGLLGHYQLQDGEAKRRPTKALKLALEGQFERLCRELKRTGVTKRLLWEEYRAQSPEGYGYSQFCYFLQQYQQLQNTSYHMFHEPGKELMIDFAGDKLSYVDIETGEEIICEVLVCTMPFSSYTFAIALPSQKQEDFVSGIVKCLVFMGCVPESLTMDNLKSGVLKPSKYEPLFTEQLNMLSNHYNLNCQAARVRKPKDKASVENAVGHVYRKIYAPLRNKQHYSLSDLNASIMHQLNVLNQQNYQGKDYCRKEVFEGQEKPKMKQLPKEQYRFNKQTQAKVQKNYHVLLGEDKHYYSVPYIYVGKQVKIIYTTDIVEIYHNGQRIGFYSRRRQRHGYTTQNEHMPPNHQYYNQQQGWDGEYFRKQGAKIGPQTYQYIDALLKSKQIEQHAYNSCKGILRLAIEYDNQRLNNACARAILYPNLSYNKLADILKRKLDLLEQNNENQTPIPFHENIRGAGNYQ